MEDRDRIVAIALLTRDDVAFLGPSLRQVYKIDEYERFDDLIKALDMIEQRHSSAD